MLGCFQVLVGCFQAGSIVIAKLSDRFASIEECSRIDLGHTRMVLDQVSSARAARGVFFALSMRVERGCLRDVPGARRVACDPSSADAARRVPRSWTSGTRGVRCSSPVPLHSPSSLTCPARTTKHTLVWR